MKRYAVFLPLALPGLLFAQSERKPTKKPIAITKVSVIDGSGAPTRADMTVLITGDRIAALGKTGKVAIPKNALVVDASGKFLIPGLWDMHVHWSDRSSLELSLANGITGVRQMFGNPGHLQLRLEFAKGTILGPHMVVASPLLDGPRPIRSEAIRVANEAEGRHWVRTIKGQGYDLVKVYSLLPRDAYLGIADEARKQGLPLAGHVPESVSMAEASDAGHQSMEHLYGVLLACSRIETELRKDMTDALNRSASPSSLVYALRRDQTKQLVETYSAKKAPALFARFVKNGTWHVPTLTVWRGIAFRDDLNFTNDTRLVYMPASCKAAWNPKKDPRFKDFTPADFGLLKQAFHRNLQLVGAMKSAGVEFMAGTDAPNPFCFPGFSLHDELELLVKAGLTPMEALQCATRNPARYLNRSIDLARSSRANLPTSFC